MLLLSHQAASAACVPAAGAGAPPPGTPVTCSGTVTNQNTPNGYGDGSQSGLTINVTTGTTVSAPGPGTASGIAVGNNNTINNSGTITGTAILLGTGTGISGLAGLTVVNNAGATIQGVTVQGISGGIVASDVTVTNSGLIGGRDIAIGALAGVANVTNNAGATIQAGTNGIAGQTGATVNNAGTISTSLTGGIGVGTGGDANVTNTGLIVGTATAARGVDASHNSIVNNSGTIQQDGFNGEDVAAAGFAMVINSGTLEARGTSGFAVRGVGATVTNSGTILADGTNGIAIVANTGVLTVTNTGTIIGTTGISANGGGSSVFNAGTITGTTAAIVFQAGVGNTVTLAPTSVINGLVHGDGADVLQLGGSSGSGTFDISQIGGAGQYQGFGTFNKIDNSTWTLIGNNGAAMSWTVQQGQLNVAPTVVSTATSFNVNGGVLSVDGAVGPVQVNNGGTLMGNGSLAALAVNNGAIVAPGHSIGQLTVGGPVSFAAGSLYQVEVNGTQSDKIVATGAATLTGGTVQAIALPGNFASTSTYTILTANGGRTGTFANVTSSVPFLNASLSYDPNDVFLTMTRNTTFFQSQALTPNQLAVAGALDQFNASNALLLTLGQLNGAASFRQAYDALSGEIHASAQTIMLGDSFYLRDAVLGRLRQAAFGGGAGPSTALGSGGPALAYAEDTAAPLAYAVGRAAPFPVKAVPPALRVDPELTYWAQGVGAWGKVGSDGNAADASRDLAGFFTGFDRRFGDWRAGVAGGYTDSRASVSARASSADIETAHVAGYAGTSYGAWNLRTGAGASFSDLDSARMIAFPGFADSTNARYSADIEQVFAEVGYGIALGRVAAEPFAGLAYVHLSTGSFAEAGGTGLAALTSTGVTDDVGYSTLGARLAANYALQNGWVLTPRVSAAWQRAFGTVTPTDTLVFQSAGVGFTVAGVPLAHDTALVNAGADLRVTPHATFGLAYIGELAGRTQDHSVTGTFRWQY